jgi:hypothetical protein
MATLSPDSLRKAVDFLKSRARPLDYRLFQYHFDLRPADAVIAHIAQYQNPDGGFGHALEPDIRCPDSSPICTTVALQYLREVDAPASHPVVTSAITYLTKSYDPTHRAWTRLCPAANLHPRAPWWNYDKPAEFFQANCGAEVIAYFNAWPDLVDPSWRKQLNTLAIEHLFTLPDAMDIHDLLCYQRLASELPPPQAAPIIEKLRRAATAIVERDPAKWTTYCARPLMIAPTPAWPAAQAIADAVNTHLDYQIDHQSDDGSWTPNWSWGEGTEAGDRATLEWRGWLTLRMLLSMAAYGRVA